jgi:cysteine-rich repeat protein
MTKRLGLLLGSFAVFAACGGGGGGNSGDDTTSNCGNSIVDSGEQCDDGNTVSGDGCSSNCKIETCGNGTVDVGAGEQCDDGNTVSGDGCSASCMNETPANCGDGTVDSGEECDDHNTTSGDGCDATCHLETNGSCGTVTDITLEDDDGTQYGEAMGDTSTAGHTNGFASATCDADADIGNGNDQTFKLVITAPSDVEVISLLDEEAFANAVRLTTTACDGSTEVKQSYDYPMGCTDAESPYLYFISLQPGTYYLTVDGATASDSGAFDIGVAVYPTYCGDGELDSGEQCDDNNTNATDGCDARCFVQSGYHCDGEPSVCSNSPCGNGTIDGTEECDDGGNMVGDGCDATCHVEDGYTCDDGEPTVCTLVPACGNGTIDGTDECDDGNATNGDGCTSMCKLEFDVTEAAEPNDATPQVLTVGEHRVKGSFTSDLDNDYYTFTTTQAMNIEMETYVTIEKNRPYQGSGDDRYDCKGNGISPFLLLFDSTGDLDDDDTALYYDIDSGDVNDDGDPCAYLGANSSGPPDVLPAGTYTIKLYNYYEDPADYYFDIRLTAAASTTAEAPAAGDLVINEYMANDSTADTNCDGASLNGDDEFVEIVNVSTKTLDLTGVQLFDGTATARHIFKATDTTGSMTLAPGKAVVVWGGGAPNCPGVTNWFVANSTSHQLGLNNDTDTITLKSADASPVVLATTSYTTSTALISANLNPDLTGTTYALHNTITGHVGNFSPGLKSDGTAF